MPPAARSRSQSTYPEQAFQRTPPSSALDPTSPWADNRTPALPADSPHTSIRIPIPPGRESYCAPAEYSTPACGLPATDRLPPLQSSEPATRTVPPVVWPTSRSRALADAADYSETSPHKNVHPSSASSVPAPRPASSSRVGPLPPIAKSSSRVPHSCRVLCVRVGTLTSPVYPRALCGEFFTRPGAQKPAILP